MNPGRRAIDEVYQFESPEESLIRFGVLALMSGIIVLLTLGAFLFCSVRRGCSKEKRRLPFSLALAAEPQWIPLVGIPAHAFSCRKQIAHDTAPTAATS